MVEVEIVPKPPTRLPFWQDLLLYFSTALVIASVFSYFYLANLLEKSDALKNNLQQTLDKEVTPKERTLKKEVLKYKDKIDDFSTLLNNHSAVAKLFDAVEELSHPKIKLSKLDLDLSKPELAISGETENFEIAGQQLIIYRQAKEFTDVNLSGLSIGKNGKTVFTFLLSLDPNILKWEVAPQQ